MKTRLENRRRLGLWCAAIILPSVLIFHSLGTVTLFRIERNQIRREIKQRIKRGVPEHELVFLKIPKNMENTENSRFQRIHAGEFRLDGNFYDIVRSESRGDTTLYSCISDVQETELMKGLSGKIKHEMNRKTERMKSRERTLSLLSSLYCHPAEISIVMQYVRSGCDSYRFSPITWFEEPQSPPPNNPV